MNPLLTQIGQNCPTSTSTSSVLPVLVLRFPCFQTTRRYKTNEMHAASANPLPSLNSIPPHSLKHLRPCSHVVCFYFSYSISFRTRPYHPPRSFKQLLTSHFSHLPLHLVVSLPPLSASYSLSALLHTASFSTHSPVSLYLPTSPHAP